MEGNYVSDYSFWIKKWELLWCLKAWETYLHALPSGTCYLPFHPGCCHIFHTVAQFLLENLLMDQLFLYFSLHGLHFPFFLGRHCSDLSGNYSSCLKAAEKVVLKIQLFQLKKGLFITMMNMNAQKQSKIVPSSRSRLWELLYHLFLNINLNAKLDACYSLSVHYRNVGRQFALAVGRERCVTQEKHCRSPALATFCVDKLSFHITTIISLLTSDGKCFAADIASLYLLTR